VHRAVKNLVAKLRIRAAQAINANVTGSQHSANGGAKWLPWRRENVTDAEAEIGDLSFWLRSISAPAAARLQHRRPHPLTAR